MDIQKAIDTLNHLVLCGSCTTGPCKDCDRKNAKDTAIQGLKELQQYRQIGTVDECRAAREKQMPKEPLKREVGGERLRREFLCCPICGKRLFDIAYLNGKKDHITGKKSKFCPDCGQVLKWGD